MALGGLAGGQVLQGVANGVIQSNAIKMQGEYQRQTLEQNIRIADIQSDEAIKRGEREIANYQRGVGKLLGAQRTAYAGQNVELDSGSALDVAEDTAQQARLNVITMKNNAWLEAWGYKAQALDLSGKMEFGKIATRTAANTTLLTSIGSGVMAGAKTAFGQTSGGTTGLTTGGARSPSALGDIANT
jgi:hypothetical protein